MIKHENTFNVSFADKEKMKNIYISSSLLTFILSMFFFYFWSKHSSKIETNEKKESSVTKYDNSVTKYEFFISRLKQSGEPSGLNY